MPPPRANNSSVAHSWKENALRKKNHRTGISRSECRSWPSACSPSYSHAANNCNNCTNFTHTHSHYSQWDFSKPTHPEPTYKHRHQHSDHSGTRLGFSDLTTRNTLCFCAVLYVVLPGLHASMCDQVEREKPPPKKTVIFARVSQKKFNPKLIVLFVFVQTSFVCMFQ